MSQASFICFSSKWWKWDLSSHGNIKQEYTLINIRVSDVAAPLIKRNDFLLDFSAIKSREEPRVGSLGLPVNATNLLLVFV